MVLPRGRIRALADDLRQLTPVRYWTPDYFPQEAMRYRRRNQMGQQMRNTPFRSEPEDWFAFFRKNGWEMKEMCYWWM